MLVRKNNQRRMTIIAIGIILLTVGWVYFTYAADPMMKGQGMMDGNEMMHKGMMGQPMMGKAMPMMYQDMIQKEVVATSDGRVIVMADNKLFKYDKDVNLIKEVELKIDMKATQDKMMQMMKECAEKCQMMKPQDKMGSM